MDIREKLIISRPLYLKDDECGYCHHSKPQSQAISIPSWSEYYSSRTDSTPPSISIGFQVENMTIDHYDQLINKGFRRSGCFLYKPDLIRGCCRMFTIRTNYEMFKLNKEHRQTINKFNKKLGIKVHEGGGNYDLIKELDKMDGNDRLEIKFESSCFTKEKFKLFTKYQNAIHNDFNTKERSFKRFLCDTPFNQSNGLISENNDGELKVIKYGAIHQCYYLDNKLIAIGFLDILPTGISSIYFIYDPEYKELALGKVSGLKEMALSYKLGLKYYYLGYYIEDCPKMNYKRKFGGEILNVVNGKYYKYDLIKQYMKDGKFFVIKEQDDELKDIVEELYGVDGTEYQDAKQFSRNWQDVDYDKVNNDVMSIDEDLDLDNDGSNDGDDDDDDPYSIPTVVPGLTNLKTLATNWNSTSQIDGAMIFADGYIRPIIYDLETRKNKRIVLDTIRLLGRKLFNDSVVFM